ncbi:MAG: dihydroxy-acid dehydratase [Gemmatimonadota bacterium]
MSQHDVTRAGGALFADGGPDGLLHRAFLRGSGFTGDDVRRTPIVGICTSWSELNPCNAGLRELAARVKDGVRAAGGTAIEFPTISISEPFTRPTSLFLRNLMSMDVEETISSAPIDGVVLLGGCDKTVPAQLMGAISANKPAVMVTAGPRPVGCRGGAPFTIDDVWPAMEQRRLALMTDDEWRALEEDIVSGPGTCNVLGTAITMAAIAEVLGFALPGSALPAAASEQRAAIAMQSGVQIVETIRHGRTPQSLVTPASLENAFRVTCALGGSTNAVIHLEAIAGRCGLRIGTQRCRVWASSTPYIANVRPGGRMLLEDLHEAGGVPAIMTRIATLLHTEAHCSAGTPWQAVLDATTHVEHPAITSTDAPMSPRGALTVLHGNLAPRGAVLKTAGTHDTRLLQHRGPAVIFDGLADLHARIDDPALDVTPDSVLVLRGMGVLGAPGMPEVGHIPIPAKLARAGVTDLLRLSDARMSGTATGTVVLHITPEAAAGGPLGLLQTGDVIELDTAAGIIRHHVPEDVMRARVPLALAKTPARGYAWLHRAHAMQPDAGCDFDFLRGTASAETDASWRIGDRVGDADGMANQQRGRDA